jgi:hypothetical protein
MGPIIKNHKSHYGVSLLDHGNIKHVKVPVVPLGYDPKVFKECSESTPDWVAFWGARFRIVLFHVIGKILHGETPGATDKVIHDVLAVPILYSPGINSGTHLLNTGHASDTDLVKENLSGVCITYPHALHDVL